MEKLSEEEFRELVDPILKIIEKSPSNEEYELLFDKIIRKEILPLATPEQAERFYKWFTTFYKDSCIEAQEKPRKDIIDLNIWLESTKRKMEYITDIRLDYIFNKIKNCQTIEDLEMYYDHLKRNIFPKASLEQIRKISHKYDVKKSVLKEEVKEKERLRKEWREMERIAKEKPIKKDGK